MTHIERLATPGIQGTSPGLVDIFVGGTHDNYMPFHHKHTRKVFANIHARLKNQGIALGDLFGIQGADINHLLTQEYPASLWIEIGANYLVHIPKQKLQALCRKYNVIVHDYMEGGWMIQGADIPDECTVATSSLDHGNLCIPLFALSVHAHHCVFENLDLPPSGDRKLALALARKPRTTRLDLLDILEERGLLDETDWSLVINYQHDGDLGDFVSSPNLNAARWPDECNHAFVTRHRHELPRTLDGITHFSECGWLPPVFQNRYTWYVSMEVYTHLNFPTEKTFKGMLSGAGLVTIAGTGFNTQLEKLGFQIQGEYDNLEGRERACAIVDVMQTQPDWDIVRHNHDLMCNQTFLEDLVITPLKKLCCT